MILWEDPRIEYWKKLGGDNMISKCAKIPYVNGMEIGLLCVGDKNIVILPDTDKCYPVGPVEYIRGVWDVCDKLGFHSDILMYMVGQDEGVIDRFLLKMGTEICDLSDIL